MSPTGQIQIIVGHRLGSGLMARGKDQLRSRLCARWRHARCRTSQTGGLPAHFVLPKNYLTHSLENAYKTWQRTIYCKQSSWRVVAEQRRPILIRPNRFWAVSFDGYRTDASLHAIYNPKMPRGGVNSERHVNPCGNRPRPTGRDIHFWTPRHRARWPTNCWQPCRMPIPKH